MATKQQAKKHMIRALILICVFTAIWLLPKLRLGEKFFTPKVEAPISFATGYVTTKNVGIPVEIADTDEKRAQGLSGRQSLDAYSGMLFVFDHPDHYSFWMPDMNFPIDIVWINNGLIVGVTENISNEFDPKNPTYYYPPKDADTVLELNSGFVKEHDLQIGDNIYISPDRSL